MIQNVKGTKDVLPEESAKWHFVEDIFRDLSLKYGYKEMRTPAFEYTDVFVRSIGEGTDIVNKEMYTFEDKGGESVTLRPEMTAAVIRSFVQNSLHGSGSVQRVWYFGPFFRYERPQKGRLRQFHQYGAECISSPHPESDYEIIRLAVGAIRALGIENFKLLLNTLGNKASRDKYREELVKYFKGHIGKISEDSRNRLEVNPLRILDSKDHRDIEVSANAPRITDCLDEESAEHFGSVKALLDASGVEYEISPNLVRGLDYYSHTVFEFQSTLLGSQNSFGGGGRYNDMFEEFGAKNNPAVGFAIGVERLIIILEEQEKFANIETKPDVYIVSLDKEFAPYVNNVAERIRDAGYAVITDLLRRSFKAQLRDANKNNVRFAVIIGEEEYKSGKVQLKNMQDGSQVLVEPEIISDYLK